MQKKGEAGEKPAEVTGRFSYKSRVQRCLFTDVA